MNDPVIYLDWSLVLLILTLALFGMVSLVDMYSRLMERKGVTE